MYTLEITESAEADLEQITEYLGIELANPPAALAVLDEIGQVSDALEVTPEMFPLCADSRLAEMGYRKAIVRSYILVYEIDKSTIIFDYFFAAAQPNTGGLLLKACRPVGHPAARRMSLFSHFR